MEPEKSLGTEVGEDLQDLGWDDFDGDYFDEFDPLALDDHDLNQDEIDEDSPLETVDFPVLRNLPENMKREAVFTPARQGTAKSAILSLFDYNPHRRPVLLQIIDLCRDGAPMSLVNERVDAIQEHNRSVYSPATLCAMLQRAGALELEVQEPTQEHEDEAGEFTYLTIEEDIDPVWTSTPEALEIFEEQSRGSEFKSVVMDLDSKYLDVYKAVLKLVQEAPRSRSEIEALTDTFEVVKSPRRFGGHFIDVLERTDAITWHDHAWTLTPLGEAMIAEMEA